MLSKKDWISSADLFSFSWNKNIFSEIKIFYGVIMFEDFFKGKILIFVREGIICNWLMRFYQNCIDVFPIVWG